MRERIAAIAAILAFGLIGCSGPTEGAARGKAIFAACISCHGTDGGGNASLSAPAIAGLDAWYVEAQLIKFRTGVRGDNPQDTTGLKMRPMARAMNSDVDVKAVAEYIATLPKIKPAATLTGGDATKGAALYAPCVACHQADGSGNQQLNAPPLNHASDWYLFTQLSHFRTGIRGADPKDTTGAQMMAFANTLPDEQAMKDVLAHISTLQPK